SDSGGFQVFSLARKEIQNSKFKSQNNNEELKMIKISDDGVKFRSTFDGTLIELTPEKSMEYQRKIGADILMAFDECIPYGVGYQYTKEATERTHQWLKRCLKSKDLGSKFLSHESLTLRIGGSPRKRKNFSSSSLFGLQTPLSNRQYLYGIIQGGVFEDLRKKSAQ
ncbi:MAG: tRNA-guanine transglycosylase, partial [Microgenomates group bacterium]